MLNLLVGKLHLDRIINHIVVIDQQKRNVIIITIIPTILLNFQNKEMNLILAALAIIPFVQGNHKGSQNS
jgi:hypothetical protein